VWLSFVVVELAGARETFDRIANLDRAAASDAGRDYKRRLLAALGVRAGQTVVDVGCGPGTDLVQLATAVGDGGLVIGVDRNPVMVAQARQRSAAHGAIDVCVGDAQALPLAAGSVDRARADRVLMHVPDPARVVTELHRVVRDGGLVALAEPDWDTLIVDDPFLASFVFFTAIGRARS
jgi:ubiquinone/menaquinone biosynthesis C-methylase UbiE